MSNLKTFLNDTGETQADFAERIGVSQGTVSKLCKGLMSPSLPLAVKIQRVTNGVVGVESWVEGAA